MASSFGRSDRGLSCRLRCCMPHSQVFGHTGMLLAGPAHGTSAVGTRCECWGARMEREVTDEPTQVPGAGNGGARAPGAGDGGARAPGAGVGEGRARGGGGAVQPEPATVQGRRRAAGGDQASAAADPGAAPGSGDLTDELLRSDQWTDEMVRAAGIPVTDVPFVTIGGGIGSFVTVDYLRVAGVQTDRMAVLSNLDFPWQTYEYLTRVSQIPKPERIRSDSASRPDNLWGFPSYALSEAIGDRTLAPLWQVLIEPIFADYYTPKAGRVFAGLERETKRIDYPKMLVKGQVRMIRKRRGGGYFIILTPMVGSTPTKRLAYRAEFIHLAVGYPGLRFLPELQAFRTHN